MLLVLLPLGLCGIGYFLTILVSPQTRNRERLIVSFPLGAGTYTLALFCVNQGFSILLTRQLLFTILAALFALVAGMAPFARRRHSQSGIVYGGPTTVAPFTSLAKVELSVIVALLTFMVVTSVIAPVWNWDIYSEYLPIDKEIFTTKSVPSAASPAAAEIVRAFPPGYELLTASGYVLYDGILHPWARILSPLYAVLLLLLLYRMGIRHLGLSREATLGGLLLCCSLPLFYELGIVVSNTIVFCFYALASIYFLCECRNDGDNGAMALSGVLLGLSYWVSYMGVILIPCVFLTLVASSAIARLSGRGESRESSLRQLLLMASLVLATCAPHLIRNYLILGNPLYPALYDKFGGAWVTPWSKEHLMGWLVPARKFFLRPRWEIFHEGFFIQILFLFFLFSRPWYKDGKASFLVLFCVLYWLFYLKFLTWPRSTGISTKLLLPSLIPMGLFAGERLNLLLRRKIPIWQGVALLALVPLWTIIIWRDDMLSPGVTLPAHPHPKDIIHLAWALSADFDKTLLWIGIAIGFISMRTAGRALGGLSAALLLLALTCRPLCECANQLSLHLQEYSRSPSYSFWNAAFLPSYFPEAAWLDANLPPDAVIGSFDNRTYIYPRRVFPLDSPPLWPIYQGSSMERCIAILRQNGITHLCLSDYTTKSHPLYGMSPVFDNLGDPRYFPLLYHGPLREEPGEEFKVYEVREQK